VQPGPAIEPTLGGSARTRDTGKDALDADPARPGWWRPVTSVFLQNGGVVGAVWNVATLAVVTALAEWHWGRRPALAPLVTGVLLPRWSGELVGGGPVDPRDFAGSSGATYFLAATLSGATLGLAGRGRLIAVTAPALGLLVWLTIGNAHGLVTIEGFIGGAAAGLLTQPAAAARPGASSPTDNSDPDPRSEFPPDSRSSALVRPVTQSDAGARQFTARQPQRHSR